MTVTIGTRFIMEDGLGHGEVEDTDTDTTGEQHGKVRYVRELRLVLIPTQLHLRILGKKHQDEEQQPNVFGS